MVDLDNNPTKLIEVVAIGKQLLITRGALTTFSIANDVAKYFAIIPAMFMVSYPALGHLNIMQLHTPQSAVLAAVIFNALIIIALVPLALRGVKYRPQAAAGLLRRNLLIYGVGRPVSSISGHLGDRPVARPVSPCLRVSMWKQLLPAVSYDVADDGPYRTHIPRRPSPAFARSYSRIRRTAHSTTLIGQSFSSPKYFHPRPSNAGSNGYDGLASGGFNDGPTSKKLIDRVTAAVAKFHEENPDFHDQIPADALTASASGLDPEISPANAEAQSQRIAKARGRSLEVIRQIIAAHIKGRDLGFLGEPRVNVLELNLALDVK